MSIRSMWCLTCGGEMQLLEVVQAHAMFVEGYEHRTWRCLACGQRERRLVFVRPKPAQPNAGQPLEPDPKDKPSATTWSRMVDKVRDRQRLLAQEAAVARERDRLVDLAGLGRVRSTRPPKPGPLPGSPSNPKPVTASQPAAAVPGPPSTEAMRRQAQTLHNRQAGAAPHRSAAKLSTDCRDFDRVWDGLADAEPPVPDPTPAPLFEPLPRSVSLVPVEAQAKSAAARALAMLTGLFHRPRHD